MRIGVFGGTFDPVHIGHLILAEQCREHANLDRVHFVPAPRPPHKQDQEITPFARRVEMLQLAVAGHKAFVVDEMEKDRPGPSFTVDTLAELRSRQPEAKLFLLIGMDCVPDLVHWRNPSGIGELAEVLIVSRPSWEFDRTLLPAGLQGSQLVECPLMEISSRDLRRRAGEGRSLRYLVPAAVQCYIETHQLYRA